MCPQRALWGSALRGELRMWTTHAKGQYDQLVLSFMHRESTPLQTELLTKLLELGLTRCPDEMPADAALLLTHLLNETRCLIEVNLSNLCFRTLDIESLNDPHFMNVTLLQSQPPRFLSNSSRNLCAKHCNCCLFAISSFLLRNSRTYYPPAIPNWRRCSKSTS